MTILQASSCNEKGWQRKDVRAPLNITMVEDHVRQKRTGAVYHAVFDWLFASIFGR